MRQEQLRRTSGFENFRQNGFHSSTDPLDVSGPFLELIRTLFFRAYMVVTNRTAVPGNTEAERIEFIYVKLLSDLLIRHRDEPELLCYIERAKAWDRLLVGFPIAPPGGHAKRSAKLRPCRS